MFCFTQITSLASGDCNAAEIDGGSFILATVLRLFKTYDGLDLNHRAPYCDLEHTAIDIHNNNKPICNNP